MALARCASPAWRWAMAARCASLLPDAMSAAEIGESWRRLETIGVLGVWAILGFVVVPAVLRPMARRKSGSSVAARHKKALQRPMREGRP